MLKTRLVDSLALVILLGTFHGIAQGAVGATTPRPNVLIILVDDMGYGDLSSYGAKDLQSPNIDAIVSGGMRFSNFYANCPVCSPSRAALLTGTYPDRAGVPGVIRTNPEDNFGYLSKRAVLLPALLKRAGYHTAIVGKWHLGLEPENSPNARGFELFHGFLGDMMMDYWTHLREGHNYMRLNQREIDPKGHATDLFTQWAVDYLHQRAAAKDVDHPFFLYLAYNAPHVPIQPPPEWLDRVKKREPGIEEKRAKIVALIEHLDDGIGKVMATLKETGLAGNTFVFFTSDNGGQLNVGASNGALRGTKGDMYEGGIREPAACLWPGHVMAGSTTDRLAIHMDLMPTVCELAGIKPPAGIDGTSLLPILEGNSRPAASEVRELYWVRREGGPWAALTSHAVRRGDWKLIHNAPFHAIELYNLKDDPQEAHDLAAARPKIRNQLLSALKLHVLQSGSVPWQNPDAAPTTQVASREPAD